VSDKGKDISALKARVDYLEEQNRWYVHALDTLVSMGDIQGDAKANRDPVRIFEASCRYLRRFLNFRLLAFFVVNECRQGSRRK
jgi:hypothetical protein